MKAIGRPFRWLGAQPIVRSLRFRLILLVLLASLPSFALLFFTASQQQEDAVAAGQDESRRLARLVAANQGAVTSQIETVLLATAGEFTGASADGCNEVLGQLVRPSELPVDATSPSDFGVDGATFVQVAVLDDNLEAFCAGSAGIGFMSEEERALARNALEDGRLVTGNVHTSPTGSMLVTYAMPVEREDGQGSRVILANVESYALSRFAAEANLPRDSFIIVFDDAGNLEQRYPPGGGSAVGASLVGTPVVDTTIGLQAPDDDEELDTAVDGRDFVLGVDEFYTPGPDGNLQLSHAMVGFPESVVVQRASEKFNENLGKLGIVAVIALVAAWVGADLFIGRDAETRKGQVRDFYHAFSTGSTGELDQIIGPGYVDRTAAPGQASGIDGLRQNIGAFRAAFPEGQIVIRELIAEHNTVVARVTLAGTHVAAYFDLPPSGKHVMAEGVETFRFLHGMIVESWSMFGELRPRERVVEAPAPPAPEPAAGTGLVSRIFRRKQRASRAQT